MSREFRLTQAADTDIQDIYQYTSETSGLDQADRYLQRLTEHLTGIAEHPLLGKDRGDLRPGLRSRQAEEHVVYYRQRGSTVIIQRVLHSRQSVDVSRVSGRRK